MRWRGALAALALALVYAAVGEARVYPCAHGFFYRPSLHRCFPLGSPMANVWAHARSRPSVHREAAAAPKAEAPPPFALPALTWEAAREADADTAGRLHLLALGYE